MGSSVRKGGPAKVLTVGINHSADSRKAFFKISSAILKWRVYSYNPPSYSTR
jgi:hypothetical protein